MYVSLLVSYVLLLVLVLVGVAFITLFERKILGSMSIRLGPVYVGLWGVLQPFGDAVKLLVKEGMSLAEGYYWYFIFSPCLGLFASLVNWYVLPVVGGVDYYFSFLLFFCISSLGVYPILVSGWSSSCKYSSLGSLRAVAQMVSYEASLVVLLFIFILFYFSINMSGLYTSGFFLNFFIFLPLGALWFVAGLAETNRTPFDFSEGESELVSGFNTEYSAGGFTILFLAEYSSIIFMSMLFSVIFIGWASFKASLILGGVFIMFSFVWVRGSYPRHRYDMLMHWAWKKFLPVSLLILLYYFFLALVVM